VVEPVARLVRIGPGARWREVAVALRPHGWALSSGDSGAVGVGGLATSGGIGVLARAHGLTIDRLVAARVVLADGSVVVANQHGNSELFWAVRGAGASFGVVVSFDFVADEVDQVGLALLTHRVGDLASVLVAFGQIASSAPRDTTALLLAGAPDRSVLTTTTAVVVDSVDPETILARVQPFVELAPLVQRQVVVAPYAAVMNLHAGEQQQHG
jgi:FAD/FMN-containing dehydrogenase